jgi:hypothetical protein
MSASGRCLRKPDERGEELASLPIGRRANAAIGAFLFDHSAAVGDPSLLTSVSACPAVLKSLRAGPNYALGAALSLLRRVANRHHYRRAPSGALQKLGARLVRPGGQLNWTSTTSSRRARCSICSLADATPKRLTMTPPGPRTATHARAHPAPTRRAALRGLSSRSGQTNGGRRRGRRWGHHVRYRRRSQDIRVRCYTPDDENNEISRSFRVLAG